MDESVLSCLCNLTEGICWPLEHSLHAVTTLAAPYKTVKQRLSRYFRCWRYIGGCRKTTASFEDKKSLVFLETSSALGLNLILIVLDSDVAKTRTCIVQQFARRANVRSSSYSILIFSTRLKIHQIQLAALPIVILNTVHVTAVKYHHVCLDSLSFSRAVLAFLR